MKEIEEYLSQHRPDYKEGLDLLIAYGGAPNLIHQLKHSRPVSAKGLLFKSLRDLLKKKPGKSPLPKKAIAQDRPIIKEPDTRKPLDDRTDEYHEVVNYRREQYVKMAQLRNALGDMATDEERAKAIDQIEPLYDENRRLWAELDYFDKHGKWENGYPLKKEEEKEPPAPVSTSLLEKERYLRNSLRPKISRMEKKFKQLEAKEGPESPKVIKLRSDLMCLYMERDELIVELGIKSS